MSEQPYQSEIAYLKSQIMEGLELARQFDPNYTEAQFAEVLEQECRRLNVRFNAIRRSGQHAGDELRIGILANKQLVKELTGKDLVL